MFMISCYLGMIGRLKYCNKIEVISLQYILDITRAKWLFLLQMRSGILRIIWTPCSSISMFLTSWISALLCECSAGCSFKAKEKVTI